MTGFSGGYTAGYGEANVADAVWLDYSLARPSDASLLAAKTFGVCRYLSVVNELTTKKIIWQAEYDHLLELGIAIHLNYEWYTGRMGEGTVAGQTDGSVALEQAKALGYPRGLPITFSDDTCCTSLASVKAYLNGVKTGLSGYYKIGYYGPRATMNAVITSGHAVFAWQPTAWSGGFISDLANLHQYFGGAPIPGTDLNHVVKEPGFPWYAGGDMAISDDDIARFWNYEITNLVTLDPDGKPTKSAARAVLTGAHKVGYDVKALVVNDANKSDTDTLAGAIAALPDQIVAKLPPGGGASPDQIKQAVKDALSEAPLIPKTTP